VATAAKSALFAFKFKALCTAVLIGLFASEVLSTLLNHTSDLVIVILIDFAEV
jgi:hypothetical protein